MTTEITAVNPVGAASHKGEGWHSIDWEQAHRNVSRLQARIVKATQEGRWGKVKALQRLLTHSQSGKALAVRRVTENEGKKTPGVDRELWGTPEKKMAGVEALRQRGYKPQPLRRLYIPKSNGQKRPLGIPTMKDRAMQALYLLALDPVAETVADWNSYGFRRGRRCADAISHCFTALASGKSAQWVLEGDIKSCFDHISHEWLLAHIPMEKTMLRLWLKAGYMEKHVWHPSDDGTPQGGIISPVLANLALDGLEARLREKYPQSSYNKGRRNMVRLVRYADDFVITGRTPELLEQEVKPLVAQFLAERGLELSPEKTCITHVNDGFDFLGQNVRKYDGKLLIHPSKKNLKTFLDKVRGIVKDNRTATAGVLISQLNPVLRGWANYHRHVASGRTFVDVDHAIFECLWRWAKRRHPQKSAQWVKDKYFGSYCGDNWRFFGTRYETDCSSKTVYLYSVARTKIRRHVKVRGQANPYDPCWKSYFEARLGVTMEQQLQYRQEVLRLWQRQKGLCPGCGQILDLETGWHNHHRQPKILGGPDSSDNRALYHPECHRQLHSQASQDPSLSLAKLRLVKRR